MNRLLSSFSSLFASGDTKQQPNKLQTKKGAPKLTQHSLQNTGNDARVHRTENLRGNTLSSSAYPLTRPNMMSMSTATGSEDAMDYLDENEAKSNNDIADHLSDGGSVGSTSSSVNSDHHYGGKILQMTLQADTAEVRQFS
jgi:hypothetical protein